MKTKKERLRECIFSHRFFFIVFPGCVASGGWCSTAQPVARSAGTQFAKMQSSFAKGILRGGSAAPNSQKHHFSLGKSVCVVLRNTGTLFL